MDAFGDENVVGDEFPASAAADPAADFLAREQEELGDLGDELGLNQQEASVEAAEGIPTFNIDGLSAEDQAELEAVNAEFTEPRPDATPSPAFVMPPRPKEEPETIRKWREDQVKRLEEKDAIEADTMAKLRDEAQQELNEWYKRYEENLSKTKTNNRENEKEFVAEVNDITPGTEWERVTKMCDFSGKASNKNSTKDMSRMRQILLQLKQQGPVKNAS